MVNETQKRAERMVDERKRKVATEDLPTRVALYVRVSSEEQAKEGYSIDNQLDKLKANAVAKGWTVSGIYSDPGESGRHTSNRPGYQKMIAEHDQWDVISVWKMDRIHRNQKNFINMMDNLARWRKDFDSIMESLDTGTAGGRFVMGIFQGLAQLESDQTGERTSTALGAAFRLAGKRALGQQAPYGYVWTDPGFRKGSSRREMCPDCLKNKRQPCERHLKWGTGKLVPDRRVVELEDGRRMTRAETVRVIYELSVGGFGVSRIAQVFGWCDCRAKPWSNKSNCSGCLRVRYVLNNPFYCGYQLYQGEILKGNHEPLITRKDFEDAQARRRLHKMVLPPEA